ncbi:MAG: hypothetical protein WC294_08930 [Methanoregula sp.]|jgi:hypothetical protein
MAGIPTDNPEMKKDAVENRYWWLEIAVPLLSFGGALLAIIFWISTIPLDFRISILGCVFASWVLAYLAWVRPKKDIVALSTPLYSFIFIAVPTDVFSSVILELLYAASLTILLVRLKYRFGRTGTAAFGVKELADPLKTYVGQTSAACGTLDPETAHQATLAFVRFAEGNYGDAARVSGIAEGHLEGTGDNPCLARAFRIVREHAALLDKSLPRPQDFLIFYPEDADLLAKPVPDAPGNDQEFYTTFDNALLLVFSAAWTASEPDRPHLQACETFAQRLLTE